MYKIYYLILPEFIQERKYKKIFCTYYLIVIFAVHFTRMPDGVTGNTSVFGAEESRFEP